MTDRHWFSLSEKQTPLLALESDVLGGIQNQSWGAGTEAGLSSKTGRQFRGRWVRGVSGRGCTEGCGGWPQGCGAHVDPVLPALQTLLSGAHKGIS